MRKVCVLRHQRGRHRRKVPVSVLLVLVGCVTTIVATAGRSSTAAQARLAALPAEAHRAG